MAAAKVLKDEKTTLEAYADEQYQKLQREKTNIFPSMTTALSVVLSKLLSNILLQP